MAEMAKEGLMDEIDPLYWCYVGGFFVMVGLGMLVQCMAYKKELKKKARESHPYMAAKQNDRI